MPCDVPGCKTNLFQWLSQIVDEMNQEDQAGVRHCWANTELLQAWDHDVQVEAASKARQLFPNLPPLPPLPPLVPAQIADVVPAAADDRDGDLGRPFTEMDDEEEWVNWVDWAEVEAQTGGSSSSGA